jgi:hypothetical protein
MAACSLLFDVVVVGNRASVVDPRQSNFGKYCVLRGSAVLVSDSV